MSNVVIFGMNDFAQLANFYLTNDSEHEVVAFTVHEKYLSVNEFMGLPVIQFEKILEFYPPSEFVLFLPMSPSRMNRDRQEIYTVAKSIGYKFVTYISSRAIYYGTPVGENSFIFEGNVIQPFTEIGNNVIMWSGNHLGHHSVIKDNNFVASHVVISGHVVIGENCFIGVNATIGDGVVIANNTYIGAGALLTDDSIDGGVYPGLKAEISKVPSHRLRKM